MVANSGRDGFDGLLNNVAGGPGGLNSRTAVQEILDHALAHFRVDHFWVPLDAVQTAVRVLESGDGRPVGPRRAAEAGGDPHRCVAVRHPDTRVRRQATEELRAGVNVCLRAAELPFVRTADHPGEGDSHGLKPIANPEDRHPG